MTSSSTVQAEDMELGQVIKSAGRWYTVLDFLKWGRHTAVLWVENTKGERHHLVVIRGGAYPVR